MSNRVHNDLTMLKTILASLPRAVINCIGLALFSQFGILPSKD